MRRTPIWAALALAVGPVPGRAQTEADPPVQAPAGAERNRLRERGISAVGLPFDGGLLAGQVAVARTGEGAPASQDAQPGVLHRAGVKFAFSTGRASNARRLGTIEPDKLGNLVIAMGDPLVIHTPVTDVFSNRRRVPPDDRHPRFHEKYDSRPRAGR